MTNKKGVRLNKYISDSSAFSRREADRLIQEARVSINGRDAQVGDLVMDGDKVKVDGEHIQPRKKDAALIIYKPKGVSSSTNPEDKNSVLQLLNFDQRLLPAGRLDNASEGLLFLTTDRSMVDLSNSLEQEFFVQIDRPVTKDFLQKMAAGVQIGEYTTTQPCEIMKEGKTGFRIILKQNLSRQIRRMCSALDTRVTKLVRTRLGEIALGELTTGQYRVLKSNEMQALQSSVKQEEKKVSAPTRKHRPNQYSKNKHTRKK